MRKFVLRFVRQPNPCRDLDALSTPNMFANLHIQEYEKEVERILYLKQLTYRLSTSFNNATNVTKLHIPVANAHVCLEKHICSNPTH